MPVRPGRSSCPIRPESIIRPPSKGKIKAGTTATGCKRLSFAEKNLDENAAKSIIGELKVVECDTSDRVFTKEFRRRVPTAGYVGSGTAGGMGSAIA